MIETSFRHQADNLFKSGWRTSRMPREELSRILDRAADQDHNRSRRVRPVAPGFEGTGCVVRKTLGED